MVLHQGHIGHQIRALLDTGCSIALINEQTVGRLDLERKKHQHARSIKNFTGETVKGAGQYYIFFLGGGGGGGGGPGAGGGRQVPVEVGQSRCSFSTEGTTPWRNSKSDLWTQESTSSSLSNG